MPPLRSSEELKKIRQDLRRNMTPAEKKLWYRIRRRQLEGFKFRRQHPFAKRFILDFYCPEAGLAIEVDGGVHDYQTEHDRIRQSEIEASGVDVLRFRNEEIENSMDTVIDRIQRKLRGRRRWR